MVRKICASQIIPAVQYIVLLLRTTKLPLNINYLHPLTGSEKTRLSGIFYISRNTTFKYLSHSGLLMPNCKDAKFTA